MTHGGADDHHGAILPHSAGDIIAYVTGGLGLIMCYLFLQALCSSDEPYEKVEGEGAEMHSNGAAVAPSYQDQVAKENDDLDEDDW